MAPVVGRLAPTPSGDLHLGNVAAFLAAWLSVRQRDGELLLRIEDVDLARARPEVEARQRADLSWLGLTWDREVTRQSQRDYAPWLSSLTSHTYRCPCTRAQLRANHGVHGDTCPADHTGTLRLRAPERPAAFLDRRWGGRAASPRVDGDPVLQRRDGGFSYPLAVVVDDLTDGVTEVVRGADLLDHTALQEHLWALLGATPPTWLHVPLVVNESGRKLSKSQRDLHVGALRSHGWTPQQVLALPLAWLGLTTALQESLATVAQRFSPSAGPRGPIVVTASDAARGVRGVTWSEAPPP